MVYYLGKVKMPLVNDMSVIFKIKLVRYVGTFVSLISCLSEDS